MQKQRFIGEILVGAGRSARRLETLLDDRARERAAPRSTCSSTQASSTRRRSRGARRRGRAARTRPIRPTQVPLDCLATRLPIKFARQHQLLPLRPRTTASCVIAVADPLDTVAARRPAHRSSASAVEAAVAAERRSRTRSTASTSATRTRRRARSDDGSTSDEELRRHHRHDDEAPVIRWVNKLFSKRCKDRASRHPHRARRDNEVIVRYRIDGELYRGQARAPKRSCRRSSRA